MSKIVLAVLATALGTAATVTFPQSANADYPHYRGSDYDRGEHHYRHDDDRYYHHRWYDREYHPHYYYREHYPRRYYDRGYHWHPRSDFQLVVPLIIR